LLSLRIHFFNYTRYIHLLACPLCKRYARFISDCLYCFKFFCNSFHSLLEVLFNFSLTVLFLYRSFLLYLSLRGGPPFFRQNYTCSVLLNFFSFLLGKLSLAYIYNFAHHYFHNHFYFLFLSLLRCFTSRSFFSFQLFTTFGILYFFIRIESN